MSWFSLSTWLSGDPHQMLRNAVKITLITTAGLVGTWAINGVLSAVAERASFPMTVQRIEWLRGAVGHVPCEAGAGLIAYQALISDAVMWNERIVHEHQANRLWYADWFSTDRWNAVRLIPLPCQKEAE